MRDLRFALRTLMKSPGFAAVAVLTLALGIGANTAIFSVIDTVLLRPLPYRDSDRIVAVSCPPRLRPDEIANGSVPDFRDWKRQSTTFAALASWHREPINYSGGERPERLDGIVASPDMFAVLGVTAALGRTFAPDEDQPGKNHVAVLTHTAWLKRFRGNPAVIGRTMTLDGEPYTIVGVLPAGFHFAPVSQELDVWLPPPRALDLALGNIRNARYLNVLGRLAPGVTAAQAAAEMSTIQARLAAAYPETNADRVMQIAPLHDVLVRSVRPSLYVLLAAVAFVLLIATANVANLMLARASARHRELAVRAALGATRGQLVRQMLTECLLLSLFGAAVGLVLALWGLDALRAVVPANLVNLRPLSLDGRVLAFAAAVALGTGLVFGLVPALQASGSNPSEALKHAGARSTPHRSRQRARGLLVAGEIALAMLLLVGTGLMLRSLHRLSGVDPGFDPHDLVTGAVVLPDSRYHDDDQVAAFYRRLMPRLAAIPGAEAVAIGFPLPFTPADLSLRYTIEGRPPPAPGQEPDAHFHTVSPNYFEVMKIPVLRGRGLVDADDDPHAPPVTVISEAFARAEFGDHDPIGRRVTQGQVTREIVGVVADVHHGALDALPEPSTYVAYGQVPANFLQIAVRTSAGPGVAKDILAAVQGLDRDQPVADLQTMDARVSRTLAERRVGTTLITIFGVVALLLALVGVYGVMSYAVAQRTQEIGIRAALGARPIEVVRMVIVHGLKLAGAGVAVGLVAALVLLRLLTFMLYGVTPADPLTYLAMAALLLAVATLASWLPARRAARVDPMIALRSE